MVVLRRQLENPAPTVVTALRIYAKLDLTPVSQVAAASLGSPRLPRRKLSAAEVDQIVVKFRGGATVHQLAARYRVHRTTVAGQLKRRGLATVHSMSNADIAQAITLYTGGWSLARIGNRLGYDATTVHKQLRLHGVPLRDTHGRQQTP